MPKVSVIVPIYGVEHYIERCVRSLFKQTLDDIEFIFIDDCTPDRSIEILNSLISEYHFHIVEKKWTVKTDKMPKNSGLPAVRHRGIQLAQGDYIIHCDSDDWVDSSMYELLWKKAQEGYDIVRCNFVRTDGKKEILCKQIPVKAYDDRLSLISYALIGSSITSLCDKLVKRSIYQDNEIIYPVYNMQEDAAVVLQLLYYSHRIAFIPNVLYYYFHNSSSISQHRSTESFIKRLNEVKANTTLVLDFMENKQLMNKYAEEVICKKYNVRSHLLWMEDDSFYERWRSVYPEIDGHILFCKKMYLYDKVMYYLVRYKLYKLLKGLLY